MEQQPQQPPVNPLLERIRMPGETFSLPSGGLFYKDGELDDSVENAEITIYPMTAVDEIAMKTPDLLFSGKAVDQVFGRCIPQIKKPSRLFVKDIDFLLTALRKVSYGEEMRVEYQHNCKDAKPHEYTANVQLFLQQSERIDPTQIGSRFTAEMPNGQKVRIEPIRFDAFVKMMQVLEDAADTTPERQAAEMVESISGIIIAVDEVEDHAMIKEWLAAAPPNFIKAINEAVENTTSWGPQFDVQAICKDCGEKIEFTAPLNPLAFFT